VNLRLRLTLTVLITSIPLVVAIAWVRADLERQSVEAGLREFALARMEAGDKERCEADPSRYPADARALLMNRATQAGEALEGRHRRDEFSDRGGRPGDRGPGDWASNDRGPGGPRGQGRGPQGRPQNPPGDRGWEAERGGRSDHRPPMAGRVPIELFAYDLNFLSPNEGVPQVPESLQAKLNEGAELASIEIVEGDHHIFEVAFRTEWAEGPVATLFVRRRSPVAVWQPKSHLLGSVLAALAVTIVVLLAAGPLVTRVRRLTAEVRKSADADYDLPTTERSKDELGQLARAFDEVGARVRGQLVELEKREERLRRFVENTTHDVAIPLTVLQGYLSRLSSVRGSTNAKRSGSSVAAAGSDDELIACSVQEAHYIAAILSNLSVASRLEAVERDIDRSSVDLSALVERVYLRHQMIAREGGVNLEYSVPDEPPTVLGDVTLLEQALGNVVHNAIRFNKAGGNVAVVLSVKDETFVCRVIDDGPGIPEEDKNRIVERSYRGDEARQREPNGRGLGLHIVKEVLQRHAFELYLERSEFGGLEARFEGKRASVS
jgi:signal transduction histidine kinase